MAHVVFVLLTPLALAVIVAGTAAAAQRLHGPIRAPLLVLCGAQIVWLLSAAGELLVGRPALVAALSLLTLVCMLVATQAWVVFALRYAGAWSARARTLLIAYAAEMVGFMALAATNDRHGLVWSDVALVEQGPLVVTVAAYGPAAVAQVALAWVAFGATFVLILRRYQDAALPYRRLAGWIVAGLLLPILLNAAVVVGLWEVGQDFSAIALALVTGVAALALPREGSLLEVVPLARTALVERLREGVMVLDPQSRVADVNPMMWELLGRPERLLGLHIGEVLTTEQRTAAEGLWGEREAQAEIPFVVDGERRHYDLRISPVTDPRGALAGRLVLVYDVTERRAQQDALARANAQLQTQNADLDDFAHTVAHDLKTSIQHLVGHAELLREDGPQISQEEHHELADGLVKAGIKLDTIVQELLLFATTRRGAVTPVPMDMGAIFAEAMDRLRPTLDATGARVTVTTDWPDVLGYAAWIETVWYNYVGNGAKYGGHPARLTVGSDPVDAEGRIRFWVQDAGPGLTVAQQELLFLPFSRVAGTTSGRDGHGLGLSIVQRIMDRLGGACGVESDGVDGEGSRFWFALPAAPPPDDHG